MPSHQHSALLPLLALAALTVACGSSDDSGAGNGGASGAAGSADDAGTDSSSDSLDELFPPLDAPPDVVTTFDSSVVAADAGLFDCGGCACDGTTHYCSQASGGHVLPPADAAACPEPDGGTWLGCQPLPAGCGGVPTCGCLPQHEGACSCEDVGGGLAVMCWLP